MLIAGCRMGSRKQQVVAVQAAAAPQPASKPYLTVIVSVGDANKPVPFQYAEISLDGTFVSTASSVKLEVKPGQHRVAVKAAGYKPYEKRIRVLAGNQNQTLSVLLEPE